MSSYQWGPLFGKNYQFPCTVDCGSNLARLTIRCEDSRRDRFFQLDLPSPSPLEDPEATHVSTRAFLWRSVEEIGQMRAMKSGWQPAFPGRPGSTIYTSALAGNEPPRKAQCGPVRRRNGGSCHVYRSRLTGSGMTSGQGGTCVLGVSEPLRPVGNSAAIISESHA